MSRATTGENGNYLWCGLDLSCGLKVDVGLNNEIINNRKKTHDMVWKDIILGDLLSTKMAASLNLLGRKILDDGYLVTKQCRWSKIKTLYFVQVDVFDYKIIGRKFAKVKRNDRNTEG